MNPICAMPSVPLIRNVSSSGISSVRSDLHFNFSSRDSGHGIFFAVISYSDLFPERENSLKNSFFTNRKKRVDLQLSCTAGRKKLSFLKKHEVYATFFTFFSNFDWIFFTFGIILYKLKIE